MPGQDWPCCWTEHCHRPFPSLRWRSPTWALKETYNVATDIPPPDPGVVLDLLEAFRRSKALFTAVSLGVFDALAEGPKPLPDLAHQLKASPDALGRLLNSCVGLRLLSRQGDRYENTPAVTAYLTTTSPLRLT